MEVKNDLPKTRQFVTDWAWSPKLFLFYHTKYIRFKCGIVELNHFFQNKVKENMTCLKEKKRLNRMRFAFTIAYTYVAIDCSIIKKYICEIYLHRDASNASVSRN